MSHEDVQPALLNAFLLSTKDSLMVLEAARRGICPVVTRRLHDNEKTSLIRSGAVFAFDETATGIKRWTDGSYWSPSRIIGNYLVYREIEKKGDGDNAAQSSSSAGGKSKGSGDRTPQREQADPIEPPLTAASSTGSSTQTGATGLGRDLERALVGSLTSSYKFKKNGLVKKTISNGSLHLISYYSLDDVVAGRLRTPSSLNELTSLEISPNFLNPRNFRIPPFVEVDGAGNLRYVGEEQDPISAPPTLAGYFHNRFSVAVEAVPPAFSTTNLEPLADTPSNFIGFDTSIEPPEHFIPNSQTLESSSVPSLARVSQQSGQASSFEDSSRAPPPLSRSDFSLTTEYSEIPIYQQPVDTSGHSGQRTPSTGSFSEYAYEPQLRYSGGMPGVILENSPPSHPPPLSVPAWPNNRAMSWRVPPAPRSGSVSYPYHRRRSELDLLHPHPTRAPETQSQGLAGPDRRPSTGSNTIRSPPLSADNAFNVSSSLPPQSRYNQVYPPQHPQPYPTLQYVHARSPPSPSHLPPLSETTPYVERPLFNHQAMNFREVSTRPPLLQERSYSYPQAPEREVSPYTQPDYQYLQEARPVYPYQQQNPYLDPKQQ